jgi:PPOX class probable FMN-dependent enzyme
MENGGDYRISSAAQLRAMIGEPGPVTPKKLLTALDDAAIGFIRRAPFLVLATADADGNLDASPKGDGAGFVTIMDANTLLIPERRGNRLLFSLQNIIANPRVGVIFMVPGTNETLRVNGSAELTADPELLNAMSARGTAALLAIRVTVRECFFHCAKAFLRSQLWKPETWPERVEISFGKMLAPKIGGDEKVARQIDELIAQDYKNNL